MNVNRAAYRHHFHSPNGGLTLPHFNDAESFDYYSYFMSDDIHSKIGTEEFTLRLMTYIVINSYTGKPILWRAIYYLAKQFTKVLYGASWEDVLPLFWTNRERCPYCVRVAPHFFDKGGYV